MLLDKTHIFVVEDNPQNRMVFMMALASHGARVNFERWGQHTLLSLKGLQVDLIILDLMLYGGVTGYDVFNQIRSNEKYRSIPIIAVSATDPSIGIPETQKRGFSGFIAKPIDVDLFPKQISQILSGEKLWISNNNSLFVR